MIGANAKELGAHAYKTGRAIETNPFRDGTAEAKEFNKSWKFAHKQVSAAGRRAYKEAKRTARNEINS